MGKGQGGGAPAAAGADGEAAKGEGAEDAKATAYNDADYDESGDLAEYNGEEREFDVDDETGEVFDENGDKLDYVQPDVVDLGEMPASAASVVAGVAAKMKQDVVNQVPDPKGDAHRKIVENAANVYQGQKVQGGALGGVVPQQEQEPAVVFDASKAGDPADVRKREELKLKNMMAVQGEAKPNDEHLMTFETGEGDGQAHGYYDPGEHIVIEGSKVKFDSKPLNATNPDVAPIQRKGESTDSW